jgi:hypothetical protein
MATVPKQQKYWRMPLENSPKVRFCFDNLNLFYLFGECYNYRRLGEGCTSAFRGSERQADPSIPIQNDIRLTPRPKYTQLNDIIQLPSGNLT